MSGNQRSRKAEAVKRHEPQSRRGFWQQEPTAEEAKSAEVVETAGAGEPAAWPLSDEGSLQQCKRPGARKRKNDRGAIFETSGEAA